MGHPGSVMIQIQGGGRELPHLIPEIRELQVRQVDRHQERQKRQKEQQRRGISPGHGPLLDRLARRRLLLFEFDLAEGRLVLRYVLS